MNHTPMFHANYTCALSSDIVSVFAEYYCFIYFGSNINGNFHTKKQPTLYILSQRL